MIYFTNDQAHAAARTKASNLTKKELVCTVTFNDDSIDTETFKRAKKEFKYKTPDGDTYYQEYDSAMFFEPFFADRDLSKAEVKLGYDNWLKKVHGDNAIISIKWAMV